MKLSASQAAKQVGKSIPTITRAIKSGKISADRSDSGGYEIEASELFRVWPAVSESGNVTHNMSGNEISNEAKVLHAELQFIQKQMELKDSERERERSQLSGQIEDLRIRLTKAEDERTRLTALLTDQRDRPRSLWARIRRGG